MLNKNQLENTFFGFTDNLKPMQKIRVEDVLNKIYRYDGELMQSKVFIRTKLQESYIVKKEEDVVYWSRKKQDYTKPKTEYSLSNDSGRYEINKTEFDYANYLLHNNFIYEDNAECFIINEQNRIKEAEKMRIEAEQSAKEKAEQIQKGHEQFEEWLYNETVNYDNQEKLQLQKDIFLDVTGSYGGNSVKLLVLIDNFDNPLCKEKLSDWLSYYNKASLKTFYHLTGINLGTTDKAIQERLNNITSADFTGYISFKARKKPSEVELESFYINTYDSQEKKHVFEEVMAEPFSKYGLDLFVQKTSEYRISEVKTGMLIGRGKAKAEALEDLKNNIDRIGMDVLNQRIEECIKLNGISPKYQEK